MMESWQAVVGYEGIYEVSDSGRIRCVLESSNTTVGWDWN